MLASFSPESAPPPEVLRLGWIQTGLEWEDPEANIRRVSHHLEGAQHEGVAVWVLPEMWSTGFSMRTEIAEREEGEALQAMQTWAQTSGALVIGSLMVRVGETVRNRAYAVYPTGKYLAYDKRHLFRMAGEHTLFTAGSHQVVVPWQGWRIAVQICYDLRFPVWSRRTPSYDYDILLYVANWPAARHAHWEKLLPARAIENQAYVLGVNRIGRDGNGHLYQGGSALYDFRGELVATAHAEEKVCIADIPLQPLRAYRESFPAWRDADPFSWESSTQWDCA